MTEQLTATITINGPKSKLSGDYPIGDIRKALSFAKPGAEYSEAFQKGYWDGRTHLCTPKGVFPSGLLPEVLQILRDNHIQAVVEDNWELPPPKGGTFELQGVKMEGKYSYQLEACKAMVANNRGVVSIATNGGKSNISAAVASYYSLQTLFIVTSRELMYQAQRDFQRVLGCTDYEIGAVGDGKWQPGDWITIALMDTLVARLHKKDCKELLASTEVLIVDEAHHAAAETYYTVLEKCPAPYRFGMSGTPLDRTDGADLRLIGNTGRTIVNVTNKELMERHVSAKTAIIWDQVNEPGGLAYGAQYQTAYKKGVVENAQLLEKVVDWTKVFHDAGLSTLILCEELAQGRAIDKALWESTGGMFIPHEFIHGDLGTNIRTSALKDFGDRSLPVLVASRILDEGVDVPTVDALILAGSRKSRIKTMQRLGRGLRGDKLIVVEFDNRTNRHLLTHSLTRLEDYQKEDCLAIHMSPPNKDLVQQLWHTDLLRVS